jgi:ammonia/methane monooxygenase subunit B
MASGGSWESFYRSFQQYAQSRRVDPQFLDEVFEEAQNRIEKMLRAGREPPKGLKALFKYACKTVSQRREREHNRLRHLSKRLGELYTAPAGFLDSDVYQDTIGYPEDLSAEGGLQVSDNSELAPGETRTVDVTTSDAAREAYRPPDIIYENSSRQIRSSKRNHEHPDPRLVARTLLLHEFSKEDEAIIRATCLSDDRSKCPEGLDRPSSREHERKLGVSYEKVRRIAKRFKKALDDQLLIEKFISLEEVGSPSESPEQWDELLEKGIFLGKIATILDAAPNTDKLYVGNAVAKHLPTLCSIYVDYARNGRLLEDPKEFNVLLSIEELMFLGCRYAPPQSKRHILKMCEDLKKHRQSSPFFIERLLRLLPAYCARENEEEHWQGLVSFYEMDENDRRFSLDALHLHAYNQPSPALWHRSKDILLERSNKAPEDAYKFPGTGVEYTLHALKKGATAYNKNPGLQRMIVPTNRCSF